MTFFREEQNIILYKISKKPDRIVKITCEGVSEDSVKRACCEYGNLIVFQVLEKDKQYLVGFKTIFAAKEALLKIKDIEGKKPRIEFTTHKDGGLGDHF